jgi:hypothetical protein
MNLSRARLNQDTVNINSLTKYFYNDSVNSAKFLIIWLQMVKKMMIQKDLCFL